MSDTIEIANTEIESGDLIMLPVSRTKTRGPFEVTEIEGDYAQLRFEDLTPALYPEDAIAFAVLEGHGHEPEEILAVEKVDMGDDEEYPEFEDIDITSQIDEE